MVFHRTSGGISWGCDSCGDEGMIEGGAHFVVPEHAVLQLRGRAEAVADQQRASGGSGDPRGKH